MAKYLATKTGKQVHVINLSKSGAKIREVIDDQLALLKDYPQADFVTVAVGANDMRSYDKYAFSHDFENLVTKLPTGTFIADVPTFGGRHNNYKERGREAAAIARGLITSRPDLRLVPLEEATINNTKLWDYAVDLFHPNTIGYRAWTQAFTDTIK